MHMHAYMYVYYMNVNFKLCVCHFGFCPKKIIFSRYFFVLLLLFLLLAFEIGRVWVYLSIRRVSDWQVCVSFSFLTAAAAASIFCLSVYDSHWWWWQWSSVYCCKSIIIICFAVCCRHCCSAVAAAILNWISCSLSTKKMYFFVWLFLYDCVYAFNVILYWCGGTSAITII